MVEEKSNDKKLAQNRKAFHDYTIIEKFEAGIELTGTEVKSCRLCQIGFGGAYAKIEAGQVFLLGLNITPYEFGNRFNHDPARQRRLLLHKSQIWKLQSHLDQKGHTLVPLSLYLKKGLVKVELGLCKGKTHGDKRETMKRKTADRETARAVAHHMKR